MKLALLLMLFAIVGKMSAAPVPYRIAYLRAAPQQQLDVEEDEEDAEVSDEEDFTQDAINEDIQDDDDSDEHETPPEFSKLFPLPQRNGPGHNFPLAVMMSEISDQGWNVPKRPQQLQKQQSQRARNEIELARDDDDDDDSDEDEEDEEEDDEPEDDLPEWNKMFPNLEEQGQGPPSGIVDTSSQPSIGAFRSGIPGSRVVYVPARQLRRVRPVPTGSTVSRQYVMRHPMPPRSPNVMYAYRPTSQGSTYIRRQAVARPQYVMQVPRRPQQTVYYMPVRRNSYNPYVSPYVPRYRYY